MILALDVGNTNIVLGCMEGDEILFECRFSTDRNKTTAENAVLFKNVFDIYGIDLNKINGAIMSSVVPPIDKILKEAIFVVTGYNPIEVNIKMNHGVKMSTDNPEQLGNDILVSLVAALDKYSVPSVIFDLGTATTLAVIDRDRFFRGMAILPGIKISQDTLTSKTSQLPAIAYEAPPNIIGTNTVDAMKSGLIFGNASMMDGMIERIEDELGEKVTVIATGGLAECVASYCKHEIIHDDLIMLRGLKLLYDMNTEK